MSSILIIAIKTDACGGSGYYCWTFVAVALVTLVASAHVAAALAACVLAAGALAACVLAASALVTGATGSAAPSTGSYGWFF